MDEAEVIANKLKPPRCPKCGTALDHLHYHAKEFVRADVWITNWGVEYHNWGTLDTDYDTIEYCCPECDELLFTDQLDAEKFLRGELDADNK
jgi:hypothetical protein